MESLKIVFRTWIAVWVGMILVIILQSHIWLNNAPYILPLVLFLAPPGRLSIIQSFIFSVLCMFFICVGWVDSVIAMTINDKIGETKWTATTAAGFLIKEGLCEPGPTLILCIQKQFFSGIFMDTKTTVITIIALSFGIFILSRFQNSHPIFVLPGIMGIIYIIINCCFKNSFPFLSFDYRGKFYYNSRFHIPY